MQSGNANGGKATDLHIRSTPLPSSCSSSNVDVDSSNKQIQRLKIDYKNVLLRGKRANGAETNHAQQTEAVEKKSNKKSKLALIELLEAATSEDLAQLKVQDLNDQINGLTPSSTHNIITFHSASSLVTQVSDAQAGTPYFSSVPYQLALQHAAYTTYPAAEVIFKASLMRLMELTGVLMKLMSTL
ncbi:hypothetical protein FRC07_008055 [Ceratobasidium sp. 392]|nr:hypothetical protein FRC07_008055 [Ceratobasidium sp. 392]